MRPKARLAEIEYFDSQDEALRVLMSDDKRGGGVSPVDARSPLWPKNDPRQIRWRLERPHLPNPVTTEELAREACLAWADGDNDKTHATLFGLFLHLYGKAPSI